ncbi:DUF5337 family protein [Solirhodobacter olei]|jgi:hypothetical protein|uniref:DUF5337 family protein n=1 Tax=Solirhodobacter olei TaxID=2493082 RepID=UPI000FD97811|nr:DUF5337 family protein [Solirhodobacter olei]
MAGEPTDEEQHQVVQARLAAIVIVVAAVVWVCGNLLGRAFGWAPRFAFLLDFAAIAAFVWALIVVWRVWRRRGN